MFLGDGCHKLGTFRPDRPVQGLESFNCQPRHCLPLNGSRVKLSVAACYTRRLTMPSRYAQWMYDWEHRLTSVDNNRVVRPLEWGVEWARDWPCRNGFRPGQSRVWQWIIRRRFILDYNRRIVAASDEFYSYAKPTDFRLETREVQVFSTREVPDPKLEAKVKGTFGEFLRFTSPVKTPLSRKQSGQCALVSGERTSRGHSAAALECRRGFVRCALQTAQHAGHCRVAADHAVSRHSHARRDQPR